MYHSITFSKMDGTSIIYRYTTYLNWGLIPTERPVVNPPPLKTSFVELPGSSESIDYSDNLSGRVAYGQRTGSWTFYFDSEWPGSSNYIMLNVKSPELLLKLKREGKLWSVVYGLMMKYIHGQRLTIMLEDTPNITYTGRLAVSDWSSNGKFSQVTINYNIDPPVRQIQQNS